jgi:hypothetical protein
MSERACIYIAARLVEGKRVEEVLTCTGIDYAVEIAPKTIRLLGLFPTRYRRAVFYVAAGQARRCRQALQAAGITKGLVDDE